MSLSTGASPFLCQEMARFVQNEVMGAMFETTARYSQLEPVGVGVSGVVCSAKDHIEHQNVAVKKLTEPFKTENIAKHIFREMKLLKELQHENIIHLKDIFISPSEDIYLVTDLMATDLHSLLKMKRMDDQFIKYFIYQILRGLKYVHSAGVIHRDLKPSNILVNENCDLKICDFGLARVHETHMTGYVSTRYYRAPEIMLNWQRYNKEVDVWSVGCIFAEMILGQPLFPGKNHIDQFCVITQLLGNPPESVVANVTSENTSNFVRSLPKQARKPLSQLMPGTNGNAIVLMEKMLQLDPQKRISAVDALVSQYLAPFHDPSDEPAAADSFDWPILKSNLPVYDWKTIMYMEVLAYHENGGGSTQFTPHLDGMALQ